MARSQGNGSTILLGLEEYEVGEVGLRQRKDCPAHIVFPPDAFDAYGPIL